MMLFVPVFDELAKQIQADKAYQNTWHCSIAMCAIDEGIDHDKAQKIAERFMKLAFDVSDYYPAGNFDESRIDVISQNGNEGTHYNEGDCV